MSALIARNPKSTKKPNIASAVAVIWIAWENTATSPMLSRWRSDGRSTAGHVVGVAGDAADEVVGHDRARRDEGGDLGPAGERVLGAHQRRQPRQQEDVAEDEEHGEDDDVDRPGERAGDLPDLGVDEQERHEQQQQRQRPDDQVEEGRQLRPRAPAGPGEQRQHAVARQRPHGEQDDDAFDDGLDDIAPLTEQGGRDRRERSPAGQLDRADRVGPLQRRTAAEHVGADPRQHEDGDDEHGGEDVAEPRSTRRGRGR